MEYLKSLCVLAKFDDDSVHQILVDTDQQRKIIMLLIQTSKDNNLQVLENSITAIDWDSDTDLSNLD
jgi:hypothetical protein